jgi:hypothetical protein
MSVPSITIKKADFQTGTVAPSPVGVLAIIAPAGAGAFNTPISYASDAQAMADFSPGPLVEDASYVLNNGGGSPVVLCRPTTATAAAYGTIDVSKLTGSLVPTAGSGVPNDRYDVIITFPIAGTAGGAGLTWTYSLDGGNSTSGPQVLPTGAGPILIAVPNFPAGGSPGVSFSLTAGTVNAGDYFRVITSPAKMTDTDLATSLEAMRTTTLPWEGVLIEEEAGTATTGLVDTWLSGIEKVGKFRFALLNTRFKNQLHLGSGTAETETAYATAMTTLASASTPTIRLCLGTDGALVPSTLTGLLQARYTSLFLAGRAMAIQTGVDPAFIDLGPLPGARIVDNNNGPLFHNEELSPNLDQLLLTALRSVANDSKGAFINNANVFSTVGSDYVYLQHIRVMNRACEIAFAILQRQLGRGIGKKRPDPVTGGIYIKESDALVIEGLVNAQVKSQLQGQVEDVQFQLARNDDLSSNAGATLNGTLEVEALAYVKAIKVVAAFVKAISVSSALAA